MGSMYHLILWALQVTLTWTRYDGHDPACEALEEWTTNSMMIPDADKVTPLLLTTSASMYKIDEQIEVSITGDVSFISAMVQGRSVSLSGNHPFGMWTSGGAVTVNSCHHVTYDTAIVHDGTARTRMTIKWKAMKYNGSVQFVAKVLDSTGKARKLISDVIYPDILSYDTYGDVMSLHDRRKRDVMDTNHTEDNVTSNDMVSTINMTTERATTTETSSTSIFGNFDFEAFFGYAMIAGAYVGMYTVFSLIIV